MTKKKSLKENVNSDLNHSFSVCNEKKTELPIVKCSIGVIAYNEEKNISQILRALLKQELHEVEIDEIIVISSGSTDKTDLIVREYQEKFNKIKLYIQEKREGKASAINLFLEKAKNHILLIESADTIPSKNTVEKLVKPLRKTNIGMTGGRPIPLQTNDNFVDFAVNLLWKLHHRMAKFKPKLGEMIAFKKVFTSIPEDSAVDEASIEALIDKAGLKCLYISDAIIYNKGPETICDFIKQRRRIATGHLWLKHKENYNVTSNQLSLLFGLYIFECLTNPKDIIYITGTAKLEMYCRLLGYFDYYIKKTNPYIWEMIDR
ncbi:MAG: glycosyltransferase [Candidatus Cloacimonetes bacterium]|nr:glycosyltransferase [Candidatus Cloacimonadota bacterium]